MDRVRMRALHGGRDRDRARVRATNALGSRLGLGLGQGVKASIRSVITVRDRHRVRDRAGRCRVSVKDKVS